MMFDDEIHDALSEIAGTAVDARPVLDRIQSARTRRKRVHQVVTVTGAGLAVGSLFTGITWLHNTAQEAGAPREDPPSAVGSPSPTTVPPTAVPSPTKATPRRTTSANPPSPVTVPRALQQAFAAAGYRSADAETLALLWRTNDPKLATAIAGQAILDGDPMPLAPGQTTTLSSYDLGGELADRYLNGGFDWNDAVILAKVWNTNDAFTAKALGGQLIRDGRTAELKKILGKKG